MKRKPSRRAGEDDPTRLATASRRSTRSSSLASLETAKAGPAGSVILEPRSGMLCKRKSPSGRAIGHARSQGWMRSYA